MLFAENDALLEALLASEEFRPPAVVDTFERLRSILP